MLFGKLGVLAICLACVWALPAAEDVENTVVDAGDEVVTTEKIATTETGSVEDRGRLLQDLFKGYNKNNYPNNASVEFGITLLRFNVEEKDQVLKLDTYERIQWQDSRLKWNPEEYGNHTKIRVNSEEIWKPDITLYNSASDPGLTRCSKPSSILYSTGKIVHVPACHERPYCNFTLRREPFGEQTCLVKYGSWTFDGNSMDVQFFNEPKIDISSLSNTNEWNITGNKGDRVSKYYDCCKEPYITLEFELKFKKETVPY